MEAMLLEERRRSAFHEAGHAVVYFLLGRQRDLVKIDMRPTMKTAARIRQRPIVIDLHSDTAKLDVQEQVMIALGGPCAENIATNNDPNWYVDLDWFTAEFDSRARCDEAQMWRLAKALHGDDRRTCKFLHKISNWTEECFATGRVWRVVDALAAALMSRKAIVGTSACKIMETAWGEVAQELPIAKLGRKWKRRFQCPLPEWLLVK